jgi:tetratricopeptide (TPR) repeat protein/DNA-binding XRE family transcriptional regulator
MTYKTSDPHSPLGFALKLLRDSLGLKQKDAAAKVGLAATTFCSYENGDLELSPERLRSLARKMGASRDRLDDALFCATLLLNLAPLSEGPAEPSPEVRQRITAAASRLGRFTFEQVRDGFLREAQKAQAEEDRRHAADLWKTLQRLPRQQRQARVDEAEELHTWALVERLCAESEKAAADSAPEAIHLSELALLLAGKVPGSPAWRARLQGYTWAFLGNARRVASDYRKAREAFRMAWTLWKEGASGDPGILEASRLLDLEASLLRDQGEMQAALERLDQALNLCESSTGRSRIILKKAATLVTMGDYDGAVSTFNEAESLIDATREPRDFWAIKFNRAVILCHLGRHQEAAAALPAIQRLAFQLNQALDLVRLRWLEGRCAAGLERTKEAIEALSWVRSELAERQIRYDEALVSLELAELYLRGGALMKVKALARQMRPVFVDVGVHDEARRALNLFRRAVEKEAVTSELVRPLVAYLYRARNNPKLRFHQAA